MVVGILDKERLALIFFVDRQLFTDFQSVLFSLLPGLLACFGFAFEFFLDNKLFKLIFGPLEILFWNASQVRAFSN